MKRHIALAAVFGLLLSACAPGAGVARPGGNTTTDGTNVNVTTNQPAAAAAPAAPGPNTTYVGIAPENAPKNAAADIGFVSIRQVGHDQDATLYDYTGGSSRWFAMRQTGVNTAKTYEIACSTNEWVWFVDGVSATFAGKSVLSQEPKVVMIDRCPFEITPMYLFTGQVGAVKRSDVPYAIRDRQEGFKKASGHVPQFFSWDGTKLVPLAA